MTKIDCPKCGFSQPASDECQRCGIIFAKFKTHQQTIIKKMNAPFDFKTATEAELKKEYDRIAQEIGDDQFFTKKELNYLPEVLQAGEQVLCFTSGFVKNNTWLITLTDRRLLLLDKGMIYGLKQISIPLNKVNAISGSTGLLFGKIIVTDGANNTKIDNVWKKTVKPFTNRVQEAIEAINNPKPQPPSPTPVASIDDPYAKLEKLASLKEKGIITDIEFEKEKSKILGN